MALEALTTYFTAKNQKAPQQAPEVNLQAEGANAAQANLNNWPMIQSLLTRANTFNQQQNNALLNQAVGGYGDWSNQMSKNAQAYASGQLSAEQANNLTRLAAERGVSTGRSGQAGKFSLMRDLGINQYQSGQMSQNIMQGLVGMAKVNPMSPMAFMVTPQDALNVAESNRQAKQAWLNAEQASKNVRSNAFWAGLAAGDATFQQASGYGQGMGNSMGGMGGGMQNMMSKQGQQQSSNNNGMGWKQNSSGALGVGDGSSSSWGSNNWVDHGMGGGGIGGGLGGGGWNDTSSFGGGMTDMGSSMGGMA